MKQQCWSFNSDIQYSLFTKTVFIILLFKFWILNLSSQLQKLFIFSCSIHSVHKVNTQWGRHTLPYTSSYIYLSIHVLSPKQMLMKSGMVSLHKNYLANFILVSVIPYLFEAQIKLYIISQKWLTVLLDRIELMNSGNSGCKSCCLFCHISLIRSVLCTFLLSFLHRSIPVS
jgi:hypothetical protein